MIWYAADLYEDGTHGADWAIFDQEGDQIIAILTDWEGYTAQDAAKNAPMLAAAPELLTALEELYKVVARLMLDDPTHYEIANKTAEVGLRAHAAIVKARGVWTL